MSKCEVTMKLNGIGNKLFFPIVMLSSAALASESKIEIEELFSEL